MTDEQVMDAVLKEAVKARKRGDYFFGAAITNAQDEIVVLGGNRVQTKQDSTRHIEVEVIQYAVGLQHTKYLTGCTLFTSCEPCLLCTGAAYWSGVSRIVFAMGQEDLLEFGLKNGNQTNRYRRSPMGLMGLIELREFKDWAITIKQVGRNKCLKLLNEKDTDKN